MSRRNRDSKIEYEAAWSRLARYVDDCLESGVRDPAAIVRQITKRELADFLRAKAFVDYVPDADTDHRLVVRHGAYELAGTATASELLLDTLCDALEHDGLNVDSIVELGAGTGRNLFLLMDKLGPDRAASYSFHSCEYTEAGRALCERICNIGKIKNLSIHAFDYRNPDLGFLSGKDCLFFSNHSIEQVTVVPDSIITRMIESAGSCVAFHCEPIGWQFDTSLKQWREQRDRASGWPLRLLVGLRWKALRALDVYAGVKFVKGFPGIKLSDVRIGDATKVGFNAAKWSFRLGYNKNFADILIRAQDAGSIRIFRKDVNVVGENPFNPASLVGWHRR